MRQIPVLLTFFILLVPLEAKPKRVPAINEVEPWQQVGQQPYEMTWVQRQEDPRTLVDFEDLRGWTLELYDGAKGELRRSREQQMWGQYVAKIVYSGSKIGSRVVARPPKPIPVSGAFDCIELWGYGNRWSWVEDKTTPAAEVAILVLDSNGKEYRIELTAIEWKQWWLIHRKVPTAVLKEMVAPISFSGIEISKATNTQPRYFFCDSLAFTTEELKPLELKPQPKRNLRPFEGQIEGVNIGPGTLPFPTREETILPANYEKDYEVSVNEVGSHQFELKYRGRDTTVVYEYRPRTGLLGEVTARVGETVTLRPLDGGGLRFVETPKGTVAEGELIDAQLKGEMVEATFRYGSRQARYQLRLWGKSLVLDAWCPGGEAIELHFGQVSGITAPRMITVPYLTYGKTNPRVLLSGDEAHPLFTSIWFDWYRTNASEPYFSQQPLLTADRAEINGGMRYLPKTDGTRNPLYERIFVTISPRYEETLPTIANPPSLRQEEGKQVLWTVTEPETFQKDHQRCRQIRSYGLDKIMQHSHEVTWRDEGDSNTMKLQASPQKGGDAMLKWYIKAQNELGWLQGVYSNYTDFCTVNTNWSPDFVQRQPDGEWRRAWPRNYALKPVKAVEFDEYYAKRIKEKFGVRMSYTDVHSAVAPWDYCDYDARVPGAGTLAATFYAYGQLLLNDQRVYGPTQSEATYQWLYAGLASGHYGWVYTKVNLLTHPLDVAFMLTKLHPLECDYGMGYTYYYLSQLDPNWLKSSKRREYVDLFLATTIGYGNMGWLVNEFDPATPFGLEAMVRSYYMMQQLQQQYAFVPPKTIEYADRSGKFLSPSQAHTSGVIADSRLHVAYENGTQVYVNRCASLPWVIPDKDGGTLELPVSGWMVVNPTTGFYEISANKDRRRIDYVISKNYEFLDGRGQWTELGNLGATGSVAMRQKGDGKLELIDMVGNDRIAFRAQGTGTLSAFDSDDRELSRIELTPLRSGWYAFKPVSGGRMYLYTPVQERK
jgi:hypothetical protein